MSFHEMILSHMMVRISLDRMLSHLRVMDHSPRFWDTVRTVMPDYVRLRQQLKAQPLAGW